MYKNWVVSATTMLLIATMAGSGWAEEKASIEMGKKLFSDLALGGAGNTKTCYTCHADGKGLGKAGKKANLPEMVNSCIVDALKGKVLDTGGSKLESLLLYIKFMENK